MELYQSPADSQMRHTGVREMIVQQTDSISPINLNGLNEWDWIYTIARSFFSASVQERKREREQPFEEPFKKLLQFDKINS